MRSLSKINIIEHHFCFYISYICCIHVTFSLFRVFLAQTQKSKITSLSKATMIHKLNLMAPTKVLTRLRG